MPLPETPKTDNLVVRQHERLTCALAAEATVAPEHQGPIALSPLAADASGKFAPTVTDISRGGIGLRTKVFLPKQARLSVTITDPAVGTPITATVRVQRVVMTDRTPTYDIGTAFVDPSAALLQAVAAAAGKIRNAQAPTTKGAAHA
ncbi:MAG: PilZ domain-containing protein [Phycisphaerales bacterium]